MTISLSEAKLHCRIEHGDEDSLVAELISAAINHIERMTGWITTQQTFTKTTKSISSPIRLPHWPVAQITAIDLIGDATYSVLDDFEIDLTSRPAKVTLDSGLSLAKNEIIRITYSAGETSIPAELKQAALLLIGHWYENREAVGMVTSEISAGLNRLISQFVGLRLS